MTEGASTTNHAPTDARPQEITRTKVLVVGAGPAGLTAAAFLADYGIDAVTISKYPSTSQTPRAHVINQRTVEVMRDLGAEERLYQVAMPADMLGNNVWSTSFAGTELARMMCLGQGADRRGEYEGTSPCAVCNAPQHVFEPVLLAVARDRSADIRFDTQLIDIEQDTDVVRARLRRQTDGSEYWVHADYVIGADGANSTVASRLGFAMEGSADLGSAFTVWVEADLSRFVAHRPGVLFWVSPPGTNVLWSPWTPTIPHTEWSALFLMHDLLPVDTAEASVRELVAACIGDPTVEFKIKHIGRWQIKQMVAEQYRKGRVFLVGDAAHRHPPSNGLGANTGIQDSYNLVWKLAHVVNGYATPLLLDSYHDERKPVGQQVVNRANKSIEDMGPLAEAFGLAPGQTAEQGWANVRELFGSDEMGSRRRERLLKAVEKINWQANCHGVEMGHRYISGAMVGDGTPFPGYTRDPELYYQPTTHPGAHLPHVWLQRGTEPLSTLDLVGRGTFTVLTGVDGSRWREAAAVLSRELGMPIACHSVGMRAEYDDVLGEWTKIREFGDDGCLLVRPDRFVAWRSQSAVVDAVAALRSVFDAVLGRSDSALREILGAQETSYIPNADEWMSSLCSTGEYQEEEGVPMEPLEVVRQMFQAMERGDTERMSELYSPEATIWHNDGHGDQSASDNIALLSTFHQVIKNLRYNVKRRFEVAGGVFQSHVARGTLPDGEGFAVDAAVYLGVADGRVTRVEEYYDPRSLAKIEKWAGRYVQPNLT